MHGPRRFNYVELGIEDKLLNELVRERGLLVLGLPGSGKTSLSLRLAAGFTSLVDGARLSIVVRVRGEGGPGLELIEVRSWPEGGLVNYVPVVYAPRAGGVEGLLDSVDSVDVASLVDLYDNVRVPASSKAVRKMAALLRGSGARLSGLRGDGPGVGLGYVVATSLVLFKTLAAGGAEELVRPPSLLVVFDDVDDDELLARDLFKACVRRGRVLLVRRVWEPGEYLDYILGLEDPLPKLRAEGFTQRLGWLDLSIKRYYVLPPRVDALGEIIKANTGSCLSGGSLDSLVRASHGVPGLAVKMAGGPGVGDELKARYEKLSKGLVDGLRRVDYAALALLLSYPFGVSCDELACFCLGASSAAPRFKGRRGRKILSRYCRRPEGVVRNITCWGPVFKNIAVELSEDWVRIKLVGELTLQPVGGRARVVYRLRDELAHLHYSAIEVARGNPWLRREFVECIDRLMEVMMREAKAAGLSTDRMSLLSLRLASIAHEWGELDRLGPRAAYLLARLLEDKPERAGEAKDLILRLASTCKGVEVSHALSALLGSILTTRLSVSEKDLDRIEVLLDRLWDYASERRDWLACAFIARGFLSLGWLRGDLELFERARELADEALGWGYSYPVLKVYPHVAEAMVLAGRAEDSEAVLRKAVRVSEVIRDDAPTRVRLGKYGIRRLNREAKKHEALSSLSLSSVLGERCEFKDAIGYSVRSAIASRGSGMPGCETLARAKAGALRFMVEGWVSLNRGAGVAGYYVPPLVQMDLEVLRRARGGGLQETGVPVEVAVIAHSEALVARLLVGGRARENRELLSRDKSLEALVDASRIAIKRALNEPLGMDEVNKASTSLIKSVVEHPGPPKLIRWGEEPDAKPPRGLLKPLLSVARGLVEKGGLEVRREADKLVRKSVEEAGGLDGLGRVGNTTYRLAVLLGLTTGLRPHLVSSLMLYYALARLSDVVGLAESRAREQPPTSLTKLALTSIAAAAKASREERLVLLGRAFYSVFSGLLDWAVGRLPTTLASPEELP